MSTVVHSARLVTDGALVEDAWVRWSAGRVTEVGTGSAWRADPPVDALDATAAGGHGALLVPGFVDIHTHGGGGAGVDDGIEAIRTARRAHLAHGTTSAVVSLVAAPLDRLEAQVSAIADLSETDPDVLGSHLEGPFLAPGRRGAHDADALRAPDPGAVRALLAAGRGTVRQMTVAPELPGGLDAIEAVVAAGAAAAVGHTEADAAQTRRAFDAGATLLTHAFNAMPGLHHRAPGPIGAAFADERVTLELIADGVHVHPDVMRLVFVAAAGRVALVTDAMAAAGAADGAYALGTLAVDVRDGVARLARTDVIAGSTLTQDVALRNAVAAGMPLTAAVAAATSVPAASIGVGAERGRLLPGLRADLVLLDAALHVRGVWAGGIRAV